MSRLNRATAAAVMELVVQLDGDMELVVQLDGDLELRFHCCCCFFLVLVVCTSVGPFLGYVM